MHKEVKWVACTGTLAVLISCAGPDAGVPAESPESGLAEPAYAINGQQVRPGEVGSDGVVSVLASGTGDLNEDGRDDRIAILTLDSAGSGVFYHLNVFLDDESAGWRFVGEEFLGDRVRFDFLDIYSEGSVSSLTGVPIHSDDFGKLVVAFFIRSDGQSFAEEPRLYLTRHWRVESGVLVAIEDN